MYIFKITLYFIFVKNFRKKKIVKEESVHLSSFPKCDEKKIDAELEEKLHRIQTLEQTVKEETKLMEDGISVKVGTLQRDFIIIIFYIVKNK